ncbi:MAG: tetratricopeptide repeat protein [Anaerolineaceae bacterium]
MTPEQDLFSQALAALQAEDLVKARELFSQLLKIDRKNVDYWLWMSAAVVTTKESIYCLREALVLDPNNEEASLGLRMLGEKAPEAAPMPPTNPLFIPWKTRLELADMHPAGQRGIKSRIALYSLLGIIIIGIFGFGIYLALQPNSSSLNTSPIKKWTVTPLPTATQTFTPAATSSGPTQISILLDATFTPTPVYVATPHNRLEAYDAGMRAYEKGDWAKAADYFKQVLAAEPNAADIYYHLGDIYRFQGDYSNALAAYQNAIKVNANFGPAYLGEAQVYLYGKPLKTAEALSALQTAVALDPRLSIAYLELANVSLAQNDPDAALTWLARLDTTMPNNALVEVNRAQAFLQKDDLSQALTAIKKAREYDRSLLKIYTVWAQILQADNDYKGSIEPLLIVLSNSPTNLGSQILLARAHFESGDSVKALSMVNSCLQQDNKFISAYLLRADIYLTQGKNDEARSDFNSVLRIEYGNFEANIGIGRVLLAEQFAGGAYNVFEDSEKLAKTDAQKASILYWYAVAHLGLGQGEPAITDFKAALDYPGYALPHKLRADAEKQMISLYTATPTSTPTQTLVASQTPTVTPTPVTSATPKPSITPTKK